MGFGVFLDIWSMVGIVPQAQYQIPSGEEIAGSKMENLLRVYSHAARFLHYHNFTKLTILKPVFILRDIVTRFSNGKNLQS